VSTTIGQSDNSECIVSIIDLHGDGSGSHNVAGSIQNGVTDSSDLRQQGVNVHDAVSVDQSQTALSTDGVDSVIGIQSVRGLVGNAVGVDSVGLGTGEAHILSNLALGHSRSVGSNGIDSQRNQSSVSG